MESTSGCKHNNGDKRKDAIKLLSLLKVCAKEKDLRTGTKLHADILERKLLEESPFLASTLINMYAKCGELAKAECVLEGLHLRDAVSWSALIAGYVQVEKGCEALDCFERMQNEGLSPNEVTYTCILKACGCIGAIRKGQQIHEQIIAKGLLKNDVVLGAALVNMYVKCGSLTEAQEVLEALPLRDIVCWNALMSGYAEEGQGHDILECFQQVQNEGLSPNVVSYVCILQGCGSVRAIEMGKQIHKEIMNRGLFENVVLGNALIDMYMKCDVLEVAQRLLEELPIRNIISWNSLISGYVQKGRFHEAISCLELMESEGILANAVTFICILKVCGDVGAIDKGKRIHVEIQRRGSMLEKDIEVGTALVAMYAKCGMLALAESILKRLPYRNEISFNTLIEGYMQQGQCDGALDSFKRMQSEGVSPNVATFIYIMKACRDAGYVDKGKEIHSEIFRSGLREMDAVIGTTLVDMYAKFGLFVRAHQLHEQLTFQDVASWNALIAGYALKGIGSEALKCFESMQSKGIPPNEVTLLCILSACCHSGLLDEAEIIFGGMTRKHGIDPNLEHHTCMILVFGCAGQFEKAISVIETMPSFDDPTIWFALLGACKKWGNVKLAKLAFDQALQLHNFCATAYVLMIDIFFAAGLLEDAEQVKALRQKYVANETMWVV